MDDLSRIADEVKALAKEIEPGLAFEPKYGGEVMVPDPEAPKAFVGGVFVYKDHVSVEFSQGAELEDPKGHLEGKGKARRHLKLHATDDIEGKDLASFLRQVLR
ncbi:DUF1801 domain-containing protein [Jannaschia sp. CCS1]|uniref:DUF1801 domain-containing protein n=1 Tax=Jannaschia sp. (strain CCS1) TaxID=290400 RepID=UPI001A92E315|nr:DUF1801 domain-containing protein [Jannaschia sp. CCS1]